MYRFPRLLVLAVLVAALAACEKAPAPGAPAAPAAAGPQLVEVPVSERHGVCLRLPAGDQVASRRADGDADIAELRRGAGAVRVYVGGHPDFPGFRRATRHAGDAVTTSFRQMADTSESGQRFVLFGHKRSADAPRLYVMFSGAEAAFAPPLDAGNVADCAR